ncbi:MAG: hypothetical protein C0617_11830 [Desulfuromonas sp.]|uniref:GGDEF domain-containing protein n=1 Tax=Desulfuromonas sp. TaxID=892 RepID=UPI000CBF41A5|nr:GGDEF domain-containing protein [Desulfuromonas sp.]PLX83219.1 MAG: hypothetical protein C0617_11830 [Desulfuromonas sp.]
MRSKPSRQPEKATGETTGFWRITRFGKPELEAYAVGLLEGELRSGLRTLSVIFLLLLAAASVLFALLGFGGTYLYTYLVLAVLATHVFFAARTIRDLQALQLLGMTLLVLCSTALVLQAHKVSAVGSPLLTGVVLLFATVPLIPWGMREAIISLSLIYSVFTLSTWFGRHRFETGDLLLLQFFMVGSGLIVLTLVGRNALVRKDGIKSLFELEVAHEKTRNLSYRDPLTGVWNRRYLQEHYLDQAAQYRLEGKPFYFILFDIDKFKLINDTYGHDYGDMVLQWVADAFSAPLGPDEMLVRVGGDEFTLVVSGDPNDLIQKGIEAVKGSLAANGWEEHRAVNLSFGMVRVPPEAQFSLKVVFRNADKALYAAKKNSGNWVVQGDLTLNAPGAGAFAVPPGEGASP